MTFIFTPASHILVVNLFEPKVTLSGVSGKFFSDHSVINSRCTADKLLLISKLRFLFD